MQGKKHNSVGRGQAATNPPVPTTTTGSSQETNLGSRLTEADVLSTQEKLAQLGINVPPEASPRKEQSGDVGVVNGGDPVIEAAIVAALAPHTRDEDVVEPIAATNGGPSNADEVCVVGEMVEVVVSH